MKNCVLRDLGRRIGNWYWKVVYIRNSSLFSQESATRTWNLFNTRSYLSKKEKKFVWRDEESELKLGHRV